MLNNNAVIFGANGQDGSWMSELLVDEGYEVIGTHRRSSINNTSRLSNVINKKNFSLLECDITDPSSVNGIFRDYAPQLCINTAAQSHVHTSFSQPVHTFQVNALGVTNILEGIRHITPKTKFVTCSTSEMYGNNYLTENGQKIQNERTSFKPCSPYAVAKVAAHDMVQVYKKAYDLHLSCSIMFNHESERRGEHFVTRKITMYVAKLKQFFDEHPKAFQFPPLRLGNLEAKRDWGYAPDYCRAMYQMLQQDEPNNYIVSTQETHSIKDFLDMAFGYLGITDWKPYVVIDPAYYRPIDVEYLLGDSSMIRRQLGWKPTISFNDMVFRMVQHDMDLLKG